MGKRIQLWMRKQPVFAFYNLAFIITWLFWIPQALYSHGLFPFNSPILYVLGGAGPLAAALMVARALYGKKDGEEVFKPLFHWPVGIIWYLVAIFGGVVIMLASMGLRGELGLGIKRLTPSMALLASFLTYLIAAIPEEIAWRGFALPRLQSRYSAFTSSLIIGALWALWHLPLLFIKGSTMATYSIIPYLIEVMADSVIYAWLYNSSGGSAPVVIIFHAIINTVGPNAGTVQTVLVLLLAAIIVAVFGPAHLSRQGKQILHNMEDNNASC